MKKWSLALSCLLLLTSLSACGYNRAAGPNTGAGTGTRTQGYSATGHQGYGTVTPAPYGTTSNATTSPAPSMTHTYSNTTAPHMFPTGTANFNYQLAQRAAKAADTVPGVTAATAVVSGNDALIGVDCRVASTDTRQRHVIEQQVYSSVKSVVPNHRIRVTSDSTLVSRIRSLDHGIRTYYGHTTGTSGTTGTTGTTGTMGRSPFMTGPTTVTQNVRNMGTDFASLVRDMGRTVTAPFR